MGLPQWPSRLDDLLARLGQQSFLRNATIAIAVSAYRTEVDERLATRLCEVLSEHLIPPPSGGGGTAAMQRAAHKERIAKSLLQSRHKYQGVTTVDGGRPPELATPA